MIAKSTLVGLAAALSCALTLAAEVMSISNFRTGDDRPMLVPRVQQYRSEKGALKLPGLLTVNVPDGEELIVEQLADSLKRFPDVKVEQGKDDAFCRFVLVRDGDTSVPRHPQGYALTVKGDGIVVASHTTDGLFYGAQTLRNLFRNLAAPEMEVCWIADWPDLDRRGYFMTISKLPGRNLPLLKRTLDTLASLKMNWLLLELGESFPYKDNPFTKRKNAFSEEQLRDLLDFCRKRHIRVTPTLQVWSHARWLMSHPRWDEMSEDPKVRNWSSQPCPESELAVSLCDMAIKEHIDLFRSPDFFLMMDEFYLGPFHKCEKCRTKDTYQQYKRLVNHFEGVTLDRGVTPIVCHDSFLDHPLKKWNCGDRLRGDLDPRTEILWWSYRDNLPEQKLLPFRNFKLIGHSIACKPLNTYNMVRLIKKHNGSASTLVYWYESAATGMLSILDKETAGNLGGFVNGADYLWKYPDVEYAKLGYDGTFEMVRRLYPDKAVAEALPGYAEPVPLEGAANAELSASEKFPHFASDAALEELKNALAKLPERFHLMTSPGGKYYGLRVAGEVGRNKNRIGIQLKFAARKIERLHFLTTATRAKDMRRYAGAGYYGKDRFEFPVVATIVVRYADGGRTELPLRYRRDIADWNRPFGGIGMRWAVRGVDADDNYYNFGIYEFANPEPERKIDSVTFISKRFGGISPVILAISARGVDRPFPKPGEVSPAAVAGRPGVTDEPLSSDTHIAADFENGMGDVAVVASKLLRDKIKCEIVDDPASPSKGKVLKISFPAGDYKGRDRDGGYVRVDVAMPYSIAKGTKALVVDHKMVTTGVGFSHANDYLVDRVEGKGADGNAAYRMYKIAPHRSWTRETIPCGGRSHETNPMKDLTQTKFRKVSFFFNEVDAPVEIRIDNIGDTASAVSSMPFWKTDAEGEPM